MMDSTKMLNKYADNLIGTRDKLHYMRYAELFLKSADGMDKASVEKFVNSLKKTGMAPGTVNFVFRIVRRLFIVNSIEWPFRRGDAPQIGQRDEHKPALSTEIIERMIAIRNELNPGERFLLALSTVYGLRREEMCNITPEDIGENTLFVKTLKHGRERYHLIPSALKSSIAYYDFSNTYSPGSASQAFWRIINTAGLEVLQAQRLGWHSIRRSLLMELHKAGADVFAVHSFMRWKGGGSELAMDARYHASQTIGVSGAVDVTNEAEADREIFQYHPFLRHWEKD